ncbi:hypothetical protein DP939_07415 [Spongiactinospora rosea]|uniref:DUF4394 domain-containing protein n=1 Tax=Spongiactinospora rosea TaxID=2248750 RepID=A0A366M6C1_9ACTN|nr:DUF4394 domain-containing protein [Spongiactinospora rosea]RBQ21144.1 hypothetical protein DP939_07415 [Spongiactinospora rosea]
MHGRIKRSFTVLIALATIAALAVGPTGTAMAASKKGSTAVPSLRAYGISGDGKLMGTFLTDQTWKIDWVRRFSGLVGDTAAIGLDFRPKDGKLYAVGNKGGIYVITMPKDDGPVIVAKVSQLTVGLRGTFFGVDFNPAADRLRVISDAGQNLRHNLDAHTTDTDTNLSTGTCDPVATGVTAAAYTNNDNNPATATTLFDVNTATTQLVVQSPANLGLLAPVGALGEAVNINAGLDIYSDLTNGKTVSNSAFAIFIVTRTVNNEKVTLNTLNSVDLLTGAATQVGEPLPLDFTDIALAPDTY